MSWCDKIVKWLQTTTLRHLQLQICVSENKRNQTILKWIQIQLQLYKISCTLSWYTSAVKWSYMQFNKFSMSFFFSCLSLHWFKINFVIKIKLPSWTSDEIKIDFFWFQKHFCFERLCPTEVEALKMLQLQMFLRCRRRVFTDCGQVIKKTQRVYSWNHCGSFHVLFLWLHHQCKSPKLKTNDYTRGTNLFWTKY